MAIPLRQATVQRQSAAVDVAKLVFAVLVIAVHTDPLSSLSPIVNYWLVSVPARLAVPFFFLAAGYFLAEKMHSQKTRRQAWRAALRYLRRLSRLYLVWSLVYLPHAFYLWVSEHHFAGGYWLAYGQRLLFSGSYYTLWFLPAMLLAVPLAAMLHLRASRQVALAVCTLLYLVGTLGQSYYDLLPASPALQQAVLVYDRIFITTRNGLFFGLPFVWLGMRLSTGAVRASRGRFHLLLLSLVALSAEALALRSLPFTRGYGIWLCLPPAVALLWQTLLALPARSHPAHRAMRKLSTLLYVDHGLLLIGYAGLLAKVLPDHSLLRFLCVLTGSGILSCLLIHASRRYPLFRHLI